MVRGGGGGTLWISTTSSLTPILGFKTGVITNNWIDDTDNTNNQLMNQFLSGQFDVVLQSCQLGIRKPNKLIYRLACHRVGVQPSEVKYYCMYSTLAVSEVNTQHTHTHTHTHTIM